MRKLLFHPISALICTIIVGIFYFSLEKSANTAQLSADALQNLKKQTQLQQTELATLRTELEESTSQAAQERIVRNQLLLQKPGEYVIQMPPVSLEKPQTEAPQATLTPWEKWQKIIFKK